MNRDAVFWGVLLALGLVGLWAAWSGSAGRPTTTQESPFTEMEIARVKGEPEAPDFSL